MCKVKRRIFKRAKKSNKSRDWERYVAHKKATASALKAARCDHLNGIDVLGQLIKKQDFEQTVSVSVH